VTWISETWKYVCLNAVEVWLVIVTGLLVVVTHKVITWQRQAAIRPVVIFRQDIACHAALVNVGVGAAVNISAWFVGDGNREKQDRDALPASGSTFLDPWGWVTAPTSVWVRYTDAENTAYFSHLRPGPGQKWRIGRGKGPNPPTGDWPGVPPREAAVPQLATPKGVPDEHKRSNI